MNKTIAIILPYKEIYSKNHAAAASIWVKDYFNLSKLKDETLIYGNLKKNLKPITKNFRNIKINKNSFSKNKSYVDFFYKEYKKINDVKHINNDLYLREKELEKFIAIADIIKNEKSNIIQPSKHPSNQL
mgnify:CR=1 FL=1